MPMSIKQILGTMPSLLALDSLLNLDPTEHLVEAGPFFASAAAEGVYARRRALSNSATRESGRLRR